ncbi:MULTISPECIES: manganese efflux pump MntP [Campylobacter]|uniref:Putative manganese efflux pump MntP n=1 Tax=Campylobacter porcelli TaxID=1660073 RepID=A0ABU7M4J7_9BACT|nr:manganese efflux pump MntP family protein [Campylobacter sp. P0024]MCR8679101.1 manganese efflux pump MntP family protein [Campylobacter sp. RM19072]MEE3704671.1 manganese efflux pump MntP family protein [Campylobacter sp. CX2-8023-23]MEE3744644.1 manganese efflux pump MntP family protein [Campylobacter sp. CX2-4855-23]MEE3776369.1 manganese efflux pump MntP family protein [Campylobacter sp. CX2-4080-23]
MELLFLAIALSMDSAALSIANGAKCGNLKLLKIIKIAFIYGFFQAFMLFIGYILGLEFIRYVEFIDHYIAFCILVFLGLKMIKESRDSGNLECSIDLSLKLLIIGAVATSIDALAVGVALSFEGGSILLSLIAVGVVCFIICIGAVYLGKYLGEALESKALILGGVILIGIGFKILISHLFGLDI